MIANSGREERRQSMSQGRLRLARLPAHLMWLLLSSKEFHFSFSNDSTMRLKARKLTSPATTHSVDLTNSLLLLNGLSAVACNI